MTYKEYDKGNCVYMIGQEADSVFIVLNGQVQEQQKNTEIKNWEWAMSVFSVLQEWKANEWDPKAQKHYILHHLKKRLRSKSMRNLLDLEENVKSMDKNRSGSPKSPKGT